LVQVFCGHQDLDDDDPHEYGVNLLHDRDGTAPHEPPHSPHANGIAPPWLVDNLRYVAFIGKYLHFDIGTDHFGLC